MSMGTIRSIPAMFVLNLITLGIYHFYWVYYITLEAEKFTKRKDISPALELLLSVMTCNLYTIYWYNKYGNIIHKEIALKIDENDKDDKTQIVMTASIIVLLVGIPIIGILCYVLFLGLLVSTMALFYNDFNFIDFIDNPEALLIFLGTILISFIILFVITASLIIPDIIMQKKLNSIWEKIRSKKSLSI
ncbi:DUF4234 domain-containing protein [Brachyspira hampsonii]|uniref:DUF4234 domain-containing protein n=1 Tax=Brachyspira hampsonii TaxID=1287055 RepID=UPI000D47B6F3|nr:DUF4234 domain-containing protein [Brachyspira hampsonii]PTY39203.1 hypothetical protein DQ06_00760 [Brachyspira hampsonii bv. II]